MKRSSIFVCTVLAVLLAANATNAQQVIPRGGSLLNPPIPAPPPPPKIEVPVVPQMDAPVLQSYVPPAPPSFSDRMTTCLEAAAASGLRPSARAAYSRACANQ
jgi:hypothetical protein